MPGPIAKAGQRPLLSRETARHCAHVTASLVLFLGAWQAVTGWWPEIPTPLETARTFVLLIREGDPVFGRRLQDFTVASLRVVARGALLGCAVAIPLGVVMALWRPLEVVAGTVVELFRPVPPLAWIPLGYVVFAALPGPTTYVQTAVVFVGVFFPVLLNTIHGVKSVDRIFIDAARTFGTPPLQVVARVILPAALPSMVTGTRIGLGIGWMCIVAAEFVGGRMGIGFYIWAAYNLGGRAPEIISGIAVIGLISYAMNTGILLLEKRLTPWRWL